MAFQLSPVPNFNVQQPPAFDPLAQQERQATLSGLLSQNKLREQLAPLTVQETQGRIQAQDTENEIKKLQLQGQQSLTKWLQEGDTNEEVPANKFSLNDKIATYVGVDPKDPIMGVVRSMAQHGVPAPVLMTEAKAMLDRRTEYNKGTEEQQKIIKDNYDVWKDATAQLFKADPKDQRIMVAEMLPRLQSATHLSPELDAMVNLLRTNPAQGIPIAYNLVAAQDKALGLTKSAAQAKEAEQKVIPEGGGLSPEAQQKVAQDVAVATNPQIQAGKVAVATAEGQARANIEHEFAVRNNAALANVPTHLVPPATAAAEKVNKEYADAKSVADRMAATMDAARKGNVVSYQIIPQEGTLQITTSQGVHRINKTEIDQYAGGGSLWQRLEGHFGKALTGKSIPDSVLNDMADIQKIQAEGAKSRYENSLSSINQTYGANFKPVEMKGLGGGEVKMIRARDPQGILHEAKEGTALPKGWKLEK